MACRLTILKVYKVLAILEMHKVDAQAELYDDVDELYRVFSAKLARGEKVEGVKLKIGRAHV